VSVKVNGLPHQTCFTLLDTYSFIISISYCTCKATWYNQITPSCFISLLLPFFYLNLFLPSHHSSFVFHFILQFRSRSYWPFSYFCNRNLEKSQSVCLSTCRKSGRCTNDFLGWPELPIKQLYYENTQIDFLCKLVPGRNVQYKENSNNTESYIGQRFTLSFN